MNAAEYGSTLHGLSLNLIVQLHLDRMPWADDLATGARRGLGAEFRLLGFDPDAVERAASEHGTVLLPTAVRESHGWSDCVVADPDGYTFAVGEVL